MSRQVSVCRHCGGTGWLTPNEKDYGALASALAFLTMLAVFALAFCAAYYLLISGYVERFMHAFPK